MGLGPPSLVIDTLKRYEAAGVTDLCIRFAGSDQIAQLEQFIRRGRPGVQVRELSSYSVAMGFHRDQCARRRTPRPRA